MGKQGQSADQDAEKIARVRRRLLKWYERSRRDLPWRRNRDPYAIWVSEIMLQQTRVAVVVERYQAFMARFPTLLSLALAPEQEVLAAWSGLGYYRRARMLHKAAQFVAGHCQGNLPVTAAELRLLPGIGAYTAVPDGRLEGRQPRGRWRSTPAQDRGPGCGAGLSPASGRLEPGADGAGSNSLLAAQSTVRGVPGGR
jgi:hypothetical protein